MYPRNEFHYDCHCRIMLQCKVFMFMYNDNCSTRNCPLMRGYIMRGSPDERLHWWQGPLMRPVPWSEGHLMTRGQPDDQVTLMRGSPDETVSYDERVPMLRGTCDERDIWSCRDTWWEGLLMRGSPDESVPWWEVPLMRGFTDVRLHCITQAQHT